ncbi:MAG: Peptidyl-prolyl cis-trans isomerase, partial [Verrucomicrobiota bacterium]|nr:Peptidyl-prolyl cis-trans isomerase [Verrucomicrobiota bacterium]
VSASAQDAVKFEVPGVTTPAKPAPAPAAPAPKASAPAATKSPAPAPAAAAPASAPAAAVKYSDEQLMEAYGYIFMLETRMAAQLQAFEMTPALKTSMLRGIGLALNGNDLPYDPQQVQQQLQEFIGKRQASFLGKIKQAQIAAGNEHFAKLKENKNVVVLPSGLAYEVVQAGKGAAPKPGQVVSIRYTGALATGQVFDSNVENPQPADLLLQIASAQSPQGVVAGMFEGLQKGSVGSKLRLHVPPALAYGEEGAGGVIPPSATLIFDVEIVGIKDAPPAPAAK